MQDNDPLQRYKSMRDFSVTPEPEGMVAPNPAKLSFVIQKHAATRLHYDFRLELDGTLKSWAVPKGPSFDPADKRMAVHVEDHPLSYGGFEGVIPPKQYGAGTVIVWDRGWWQPVGDPHEGYAKGKLKFKMHGEKLKGGWTLVRMHGRPDDRQQPWLLIKERDDTARPSAEFNVVEMMPDSVLSGRSVSEADGPRSLSSGGREPAAKKAAKKTAKNTRAEPELTGSKRSPLPPKLTPQLATLVDSPPPGDDWTYEIKYDGYRILARVDGSDVRLFTRNGNDWTSKLTRLATTIKSMRLPASWLDGEIVVLDANGIPNFGLLQNAFDDASMDRIVYYVFDVPYHAGLDLSAVPLLQRRALLKALIDGSPTAKVRYSESFDAPGAEVLAKAQAKSDAAKSEISANPRVDLHPSLSGMRITHPERVIDPGSGMTKLDLVDYYARVAPYILPHLARRPVSLVRAPSGIDRQLFFQKHSDTLKIPGLRELDQSIDPDHPPYIEVPSSGALVGAAQMNVVEFHTWNSTTRSIDKPDRMLFDLDPGEGLEWPMMQEAAALVHDFLGELGLKSWLKTSGGKGLHVVVPLVPRDDYDTVKDFSRSVVEHIARVVPSRFVAKSGPSNRVGKIFIDYLRNGFGATTATAWSARARKGLGVSVPVDWSELKTLTGGAQWTIVDAHERFAAGKAAWAGYSKSRQTLVASIRKLGSGRR